MLLHLFVIQGFEPWYPDSLSLASYDTILSHDENYYSDQVWIQKSIITYKKNMNIQNILFTQEYFFSGNYFSYSAYISSYFK